MLIETTIKCNNRTKQTKQVSLTNKNPPETYFWEEFPVRRGGGIGARVVELIAGTGGKEICFLARGGAGGSFSEDDEIFERVSSLELLLLLLVTIEGSFA